jgi:hypothetical protein
VDIHPASTKEIVIIYYNHSVLLQKYPIYTVPTLSQVASEKHTSKGKGTLSSYLVVNALKITQTPG